MIDIQKATFNTAGAYVCIDGLYLFAIGARPSNGRTPVVRLGGHREGAETGWQCAVREVYEESGLQITPLPPPTTYLLPDGDRPDLSLQEVPWKTEQPDEAAPWIVVAYQREQRERLSLMYIAETSESPAPSSEVRGLLLLTEQEVHRLCRETITLEDFIRCGGNALLNHSFDKTLILEPFLQLRLLSRMLLTANAKDRRVSAIVRNPKTRLNATHPEG